MLNTAGFQSVYNTWGHSVMTHKTVTGQMYGHTPLRT
jgi:hypothetical protein